VENSPIFFSILIIQIDEPESAKIKAILVQRLLEEICQRVFSLASHKRVEAHVFEDHTYVLVLEFIIFRYNLFLDWIELIVRQLVGVEGKEGWTSAEEFPRLLHAGWDGVILFGEICEEGNMTQR
jgi:hypothetical protein